MQFSVGIYLKHFKVIMLPQTNLGDKHIQLRDIKGKLLNFEPYLLKYWLKYAPFTPMLPFVPNVASLARQNSDVACYPPTP